MGEWWWYRETRWRMGALLCVEGRWQDALCTLLEVCYLDLNGLRNRVDWQKDTAHSRHSRPFHPREAKLSRIVVEVCGKIAAGLELTADKVHACFQRVAERNFRDLKLPLEPERAWRRFARSMRAAGIRLANGV